MTKVIALFNHKGGVAKTTTTYHLGSMLADMGLRVLLVDADPQCNLTGLTLGIEDYDSLFKFYDSKQNNDIYNSLANAFGFSNNAGNYHETGIIPTKTNNSNMSILAGHINFAKFDLQIATALTSSESIPLLKPLLGSINNLIRKTSERGDFDIVLIDMSPSISATNMCIFMASDYFIVPTSPDFYCYQAIDSLADVLPEWASRMKNFKDGFTLPKKNPQMLGIISQNYRVYTTDNSNNGEPKTMSKSFEQWANKIKDIVKNRLAPQLEKESMIVSEEKFKKYVDYDVPFNLAGIQNFNSLIPISQKTSKPIFSLTQKDVGFQGASWEKEVKGKMFGAKHDIENAKSIYLKFATSVCGLIDLPVADKTLFDTMIAKASKSTAE